MEFLNDYEELKRQEFVDKFEALIEQRFKERLLEKLEKGEEILSEYSDEEDEQDLPL